MALTDNVLRPRAAWFVMAGLLALAVTAPTVARGAADAPDVSSGDARRQYNFNTDWKLFVGDAPGAQLVNFDDAGWKPVTLPHAWNEDSAFRVSIEQLPTGI